jgi:MerR family transcriptional regulator/heat shock protein HspR
VFDIPNKNIKYSIISKKLGVQMALLNNEKEILPLSSIAEILSAKIRTLKMYEDKGLLPAKKETSSKKLYSINDVKLIAFTHYLASVKKINANGIKYILEMLHNNMDENHKEEFLAKVEEKMEKISGIDVKDVDLI